jgi:endonuclease YncB( thermonuclease family)
LYIAGNIRNGIGYNTAMISGLTRAQVISLALIVFIGVGILGAVSVFLASALQASPDGQATALSSPTPTAQQAASPLSATSSPTQTLELQAFTLVPTVGRVDPLACLANLPPAQDARVVSVLEDALIQVELAGGMVSVRLIGVDPAGSGGQVLALLRELVEGKAVRLLADAQDSDAQGSLLRYVLVGDTFVNHEMVRRGAALPGLYPPGMVCSESLLEAGRLARAEGLGYWSLQPEQPGSALPAATASAQACDCTQVYACGDFKTRAAAQACYNACGDYRNTTLDPDHNGMACEALP